MDPLYSQIPTLRVFSTIEDPSNIGNRLVMGGVITGVPPTSYADVFGVSCVLQRDDSSIVYKNAGTVAVPSWSEFDTSTGGLPALTDGDVWVGNGSDVATAVALSGDITITNAGVAAIGANVITKAMLAPAITPSNIVVFSGKHSYAGGLGLVTITVTGLLATDIVFAQIESSVNMVNVVKVTPSTDTITIELDGNPGASVFSYQALRATA